MSTGQRVTRSASRQSLSAATASPHEDASTSTGTPATKPKTKRKVNKPESAAEAAMPPPAKQSGRRSTGAAKAIKSAASEPDAKADDPSTPPRKRQKKSGGDAARSSPPKEGPQHHGGDKLDMLAEQHVLEDTPHTPHPPPARPAEPHQTNATLETPRGSRVVAYRSEKEVPKSRAKAAAPKGTAAKGKGRKSAANNDASSAATEAVATDGDKSNGHSALPAPTTDTNRLLSDGVAHLLKVAPKLKPVIDAHHCHVFSPEGLAEPVDPFRALSSGILAQQVSGAAAAAIKRRFVALFLPEAKKATLDGDTDPYLETKSAFPTPEQVAKADIALLRTAGLSGRKAEYVQGLAEKFASGELSARILVDASYDEVLEKLIAVRGLGKWSVEMFACFGLKRMDVFSTGDLGVQRGMAAFAGRDVAKLKNKGGKWKYMSEQDMIEMAEKFAPYRSLFMWYMWRVEDVNVDAIQNA